jgi:thiamine biosynthesis lipoprotein
MNRQSWVEQIMGMPISVSVRSAAGIDRDPGIPAAVAAVFDQLREIDRLFSTYRPDSQVSQLNRFAIAENDCHPLVREVIDLCHEARERTDGYFDAWLPGPAGHPAFDPSGLVKGWAVERAAKQLAGLANQDYYVNAGGDIALAVCPRSPSWRIGIEDPFDRSQILAVREVRSGGVATSGTAARGAHIVDPSSGRAADTFASVTLIGPSLRWADVYATAAFARGAGAVEWLAKSAPSYEVIAVEADTGRVLADLR